MLKTNLIVLLFFTLRLAAIESIQPELPGASGAGAPLNPNLRALDYPGDLRGFRQRALKADGVFAPDIAFTVTHCPKCRKAYVFGTFPRLTRKPFDSLADVHKVIEETVRKAAPQKMYSARENGWVARACPYCGEAEHNAAPTRAYFCHSLPETGDDLHIDYAVHDGVLTERTFLRVGKDAKVEKVALASENETSFNTAFGCHFSLRAVWQDIFAANWESEKVVYENVAPGMYFIFRSEKINDTAFREFADTRLKADRDEGKFTRLESMLKIDNTPPGETYQRWAGQYAEKLQVGRSECFVGVKLSELRSAAVSALATRGATLNLKPEKPSSPGSGFVERGPLKIETSLAPLVKGAVLGGLSLQQACSLYLAEGSYALDNAERIAKALQAALPDCDSEFEGGRKMILRDSKKEERKVDLLTLAGKLEPTDAEQFSTYISDALRWDKKEKKFGPAPKSFEISPVGLPAYVQKRIKPAGFFEKKNAPTALHEPGRDAEGKTFDYCYTSECSETVVYIDPSMPRFKEIPDVNAARQQYALYAGTLPTYVDAQDALTFAGGLPGLLECKAAIVCGTDVSSLANDDGCATRLADFCGLSDATKRVHIYAFSTHCAAVAPRSLDAKELDLVRLRMKDLLADARLNGGDELNLHFNLPRAEARGKVLRRRK